MRRFLGTEDEYVKYRRIKRFQVHTSRGAHYYGEGKTKTYEPSPTDLDNRDDILNYLSNLRFDIMHSRENQTNH